MKSINAIDEYYFGSIDDSNNRVFKDNQIGYFIKDYYSDEYTFHPYDNQEQMKNIYNALNIIRKDFSEVCLGLYKSAVNKLEYSIKEKQNKEED